MLKQYLVQQYTALKFGEHRYHMNIITLQWTERVLSVNSERLIMQMADRLAEDGYRDAGYIYVSIDVSCIRSGSRNLCCGFHSLKYDTS